MNCSMTKFAIAATLLAVSLLTPVARAQHGGGPGATPMQPLPVAEKPATVSFAEGVKEDAALEAFLRDFAEALRTHDGKPFLPHLADKYTIEGYPNPNMKAGFVMALTMIKDPLEIVVTAIEPQTDGTKLVKAGFKFAKRTANREFTLTADNMLISTSLISMKRAAGEPARSH